jgi:uncharacterized protein YycO
MNTRKITLWGFKADAFTGSWIYTFFSKNISFWTNSDWIHVGFSVDDVYYESFMTHGVTKSSKVREGAIPIYTWEVPDNLVAETWLTSQLGKKYDWRSFFGFILPCLNWFNKNQQDKWFCSELSVSTFRAYGITILGTTPSWKISPADLVNSLHISIK